MGKIFRIKELYFIKCSKNNIEERCKNAIQEYDFSNIFCGEYIKAWIEKKDNINVLYIASPNVIYFPEDSSDLFLKLNATNISLKNIEKIQFNNINTSKVVDMSYMFSNFEFLTNLDLSIFNTENVANMSNMFSSCYKLRAINLSSFNTKNVKSMSEMFFECKSLEMLSLENFDTSNVEYFDLTFGYMKNLRKLNLANFTFNLNLRTAYRMFKECKLLNVLDISNIEFQNVDKKIYCYEYIRKTMTYPKYYGMFEDIYHHIKIRVKDSNEKNNVLSISLNYLKDENISIKH